MTFRDFKHSYNKGDVSLTLSRRSDICPVQIVLLDYLFLRGFSNGPLFMTPDGTAVSRHSFTQILSLVFQRCGLDSSKYKGHSFRIGAATFAAVVSVVKGTTRQPLAEKFFGITLRLGYQAQNYAFASNINCVVYVSL